MSEAANRRHKQEEGRESAKHGIESETIRMNTVATLFQFHIGDAVRHCDSDRSIFHVTRRWMDVDAREGHNLFYELQEERPLFGQGKIGPVEEAKLSPTKL